MDLQELQETFELLGEWDARYNFISDLGAGTEGLPPEKLTEDYIVNGCMSKVWIAGELKHEDGCMCFCVDGEGPIVKGLAAMLSAIYSGRTPEEVMKLDADKVFDVLGLAEHLSPNRHVGMYAMVERIKRITRDCMPAASQIVEPEIPVRK